jgi:ABC-type glycerol-3-phosphate transport system substrate-binding protein
MMMTHGRGHRPLAVLLALALAGCGGGGGSTGSGAPAIVVVWPHTSGARRARAAATKRAKFNFPILGHTYSRP